MLARLPFDPELVAALDRGPGVARDDGDPAQRRELHREPAIGQLVHALDAGHGQRLGRVEGGGTAAHDRGPRDDGEFHAVEHHIGTVDGRPVVMSWISVICTSPLPM